MLLNNTTAKCLELVSIGLRKNVPEHISKITLEIIDCFQPVTANLLFLVNLTERTVPGNAVANLGWTPSHRIKNYKHFNFFPPVGFQSSGVKSMYIMPYA